LAAAVRVYLNDAELRRKHGRNGRQWMLRDFDPEVLREGLLQEFVRLLGERECGDFASEVTATPAEAAH
jgi:hypothetical protein